MILNTKIKQNICILIYIELVTLIVILMEMIFYTNKMILNVRSKINKTGIHAIVLKIQNICWYFRTYKGPNIVPDNYL